jgi:hypothetical protein
VDRTGIGQIHGGPTPILPAVLKRIGVNNLVSTCRETDHERQQKYSAQPQAMRAVSGVYKFHKGD